MRRESRLTGLVDLRPARVHEAEGRGRRSFALFQALRHPGPVVWILPAHLPELPMLRGLPQGVGERLYLLRPKSEIDFLAIAYGTFMSCFDLRVLGNYKASIKAFG